jgi:hypothetical protein
MKNKINDTNINFRKSGIYDAKFYYEYKIKFNLDENDRIQKKDWKKLQEKNKYEDELKEYIDEENASKRELDNWWDARLKLSKEYKAKRRPFKIKMIDFVSKYIAHESISFYKPKTFDKEIAKKCKIITLDYDDIILFAITGYEVFWKLDAYQALVDGTIDKNSKLFSDYSYFENNVGKELTQEVIKAIQKNK